MQQHEQHRPRRPRAPIALAALVACAAAALAVALPAVAHRDGERDGFEFDDDPAGTVASFDPATSLLTVDLAEGGSVEGVVTRWTRIKCDGKRGETGRGGERGERRTRARLGDFGDDDGRSDGWDDKEWWGRCSTDALTPGAAVDDAVLVLADGRALFLKVDLDD